MKSWTMYQQSLWKESWSVLTVGHLGKVLHLLPYNDAAISVRFSSLEDEKVQIYTTYCCKYVFEQNGFCPVDSEVALETRKLV